MIVDRTHDRRRKLWCSLWCGSIKGVIIVEEIEAVFVVVEEICVAFEFVQITQSCRK